VSELSQTDAIEEEKPLDPAAERLRRKMLRLLAVSIGTLMIGVMAVLGAVVYKIGSRGDSGPEISASAPVEAYRGRIDLPQGARILSTSLDRDRVLLHLELAGGAQSLMLYSLSGGGILAEVAVD